MSDTTTDSSTKRKATTLEESPRQRLRVWQALPTQRESEAESVSFERPSRWSTGSNRSTWLTGGGSSSWQRGSLIQTKLTVNQPDDQYEQEAERVADTVMRMPATAQAFAPPPANQTAIPATPTLLPTRLAIPTGRESEKAENEEPEWIDESAIHLRTPQFAPPNRPTSYSHMPVMQAQLIRRVHAAREEASEESPSVTPALESRIQGMNGGGSPLPNTERSFFESRMGADFSGVRIHTDSGATQSSRDLSARAFTVGNNIAFNSGEYQPGTSAGRRLLAHELTHTMQQGGVGELKRKAAEQFEEGKQLPQSVTGEVESQAPTEEAPSNLGAEAIGGSGEARTAKPEAVGESAEVAANEQTDDLAMNETEKSPDAEGDEQSQNQMGVMAEPEALRAKDAKEEAAQTEPQPAEEAKAAALNLLAVKEMAPKAEAGDALATAAGAALAEIPEAQALAKSVEETAMSDMVSKAGAGLAEIEAQKEEATAQSQEASATLAEVESEAANLASAEVDFASPEELESEASADVSQEKLISRKEESGDEGDKLAFMEEQRIIAQSMVSGFMGEASTRTQEMTVQAAQISEPIQGTAETVKATIQNEVEQQKATISARIAEVRTQAESQAEALRTEIEAQYETTVATIQEATLVAREQVEVEYAATLESLIELENTQVEQIDVIFDEADQAYRAAGQRVADEAETIGGAKEQEYRSQVRSPKVDDSLLDGPLTDNRNEARADAARKTTAEFKQSLINEANSQADGAKESKPQVVQKVRETVTQYRESLKTHYDTTVKSLQGAEQDTLATAAETKTRLLASVDSALQSTLKSLTEQETAQLQLLSEQGQQQLLGIDTIAQQATASLQQAIGQGAANFVAGQQSLLNALQGLPVPEPEVLDEALANAMAQIDSGLETVLTEVETQQASIEERLNAAAETAIQALAGIVEGALEGITATEEGFATTLSDLKQAATEGFTKVQENHTRTLTESTTAAIEGFQQTLSEVVSAFTQLNEGVRNTFDESITKLEQGLRDALHGKVEGTKGLIVTIEEEAEKAAAQVQPRWKGIVKWVLIIAVVVVAAVVLGPFLVGALGAVLGSTLGTIVAGAIVGGLTGAAIQVINNWHDNKNLLEGIGTAILVGAIGGALGAGVGMALQGPIQSMANTFSQPFMKAATQFVGETVVDFASNIGIELLFKGELTWEAVGTALLSSIIMQGAFRVPGVKNTQTRFQNRGADVGTSFNSRFGLNGADVPTTTTQVDTDGPTPADVDGATSGKTNVEEPDVVTTSKPKSEATSEVGPSGKPWDEPTMTKEEFISDYRNRYPNSKLSDEQLAGHFDQGTRLNPETGRLKKPVRPVEAAGTRELPTEGEAFEGWQNYKPRGDELPCFPAGTLVKTARGNRRIEELEEEELVFAYDFEAQRVVSRPVTAMHQNWTAILVVADTDYGELSSTLSHPYWVESEHNWLPAAKLQAGMTLRLIDDNLATIDSIETYATEEGTYNFEVSQQHNYFVGEAGILVHNGSGFESLDTSPVKIYEVIDVNTDKVVYVGQSVQDIKTRLNQHVNDPKSALYVPEDSPLRNHPNFPENIYDSRLPAEGNWTKYEAAVWEQHLIDENGGKEALRNRQNAITPENFEKYKNLHNPCM